MPYPQVVHLPGRGRRAPSVPEGDALRPPLTDLHPLRSADPGATGFVLSLLSLGQRPVLWVQDRLSRREAGALYLPGLGHMASGLRILQVRVSHPRDVLWAMEEGASCAALSAVVGEIHGAPAALDFTATKRLAIRAERSGVPVYLIRGADPGVLSAARMRWRVASLPSQAHPHDPRAPGWAQWDAELFRAQGRAPGRWVARHDPGTADRLSLVSRPDDRAVETGGAAISDAAGS
ncbi:hypothetical protein [Palleronia sp. LCG004]|uniref:ImuA family protein n=1 Tax=Palleronia sp. LCG004 TaxID=3079304 RepID=UPI00294239B2|nr:hypothetical protein [Palleronia sp. LCG004]WOI55825.1 hypothetical protein RVY76_12380 [Palleronia sp. LCG004]